MLNQQPGDFHWKDGGTFLQERDPDHKFLDDVPDPDKIAFQRPPRLFDNPLRPGTDPSSPGFLIASNYVGVYAREYHTAPPTNLKCHIGRIKAVDAARQEVTVVWYATGGHTIERARWRPWTGRQRETVPNHSYRSTRHRCCYVLVGSPGQ